NAAASRFHAVLEGAEGRYTIEDKGSRNGTYVNGERVTGRMPLRSGDRVEIAGVELTYLEEADAVVGPAGDAAAGRDALSAAARFGGAASPPGRGSAGRRPEWLSRRQAAGPRADAQAPRRLARHRCHAARAARRAVRDFPPGPQRVCRFHGRRAGGGDAASNA